MAVPMADGVVVEQNWDTLGMRGTASNDVRISDVFIPDERVLANRPHGVSRSNRHWCTPGSWRSGNPATSSELSSRQSTGEQAFNSQAR